MKFTKKLVMLVMIVVTALALSVTSFAADKKEKISSVTLKLEGTVPVSGDDTEDMQIDISTSSAKCDVLGGWSYDTKKEQWKRGDVPVIEVELEADDDYKFTSSTKVNVSGLSSSVKSKSTKESGSVLRVYIKIKAVGGDVEEPDELEWSGYKATWEEVDDADYYEVELKRNSSKVASILTDDTKFNFHQWMTKAGEYKFRVRTIANHDGKKSHFTEYSDELDIDSSDVYEGTIPTQTDYRSGANKNNSNNNSSNGSSYNGSLVNTVGEFRQNEFGWFFVQNNNYVTNMWVANDGYWYHIGANGYMETGWITDTDGNVYYLNPYPNGPQGAMLTGLQNINGMLYYFNETSDPTVGPCGARRTGYVMANNKWYFFDTNSGAAWMNCATPNGTYAGPDGTILLTSPMQ